MMLQNKVAIIYGAGGSLGSTVAKAFACAGARVFLAGRNLSSVKRVADEISSSGGTADADEVDATDETAVNDHIAGVLKRAGRVDISFNLVDLQVVQNKPLIEITLEEFVRPVSI